MFKTSVKDKKSKSQNWVRKFEISNPRKHPKGHMIYDVTSVLYPEGFPEVATNLKVTKRYSQFLQLHKMMFNLHRGLYLKGTFPVLPKNKKLFAKADDPEMISERMEKCLVFLQFLAEFPPLFNSQAFSDFFIGDMSDSSDESSSEASNVIALQESGNVMDASMLSAHLKPDTTPSLRPDTPTTPEEEMRNLPDYLSEAAEDVSRAIQYELEEQFEESIDCYRNAIGTLLSSVQQDKCLKRQASVKRRIAQYISKAEDLVQLKNKSGIKKSTSHPHLTFFGDITDLKKYKVLDVVSQKVLIAKDFRTDQKVIIKVVHKSPQVFKSNRRSLLPVGLEFMVKLFCYFETEDSLFLVLEYLPRGQMYSVISKIFLLNNETNEEQNKSGSPDKEAMSLSPETSEFNANTSIIKPSPSFIANKSERTSQNNLSTFEIVHKGDDDTENIYCVSNDCIEKVDVESISQPDEYEDEEFDFMDDCVDEEAVEVKENMDQPSDVLLRDSKALLNVIDSKLGTDMPEQVLDKLQQIENTIFSQMREANLDGSRSPVSPFIPNTSGQTSKSSSPEKTSLIEGYGFRDGEQLPVDAIRMWSYQLFKTLFSLHENGILVKDLNPRNLLLDDQCNLKLSYQFDWVSVDHVPDKQAEQCFYTAPEVSSVLPLTPACDFWSAGVIIYELATGKVFVDNYPSGLRMHTPVEFPETIHPDLMSLLSMLLKPIPDMRIASSKNIQQHPFFKHLTW